MSKSNSPMPEGDPKWREAFQQSDRNTQVREISKALAAIEPGATATSKLRLAGEFENAVFRAANSYEDYKKQITKRLKKVAKAFIKKKASSPVPAVTPLAVTNELRRKYRESLLYVCEKAAAAIQVVRIKHSDEKAKQLKQHTDICKEWATDLGLMGKKGQATTMSMEQLEKLKGQMERRLEHVRTHVVKAVDPDKLLGEQLAKREVDFFGPNISTKPSRFLAERTRLRYESMHKKMVATQPQKKLLSPAELLSQSLEGAHAKVPMPTKESHNQQTEEKAALVHLDKMRASGSVLLAYLLSPDKSAFQANKVLTTVHNEIAVDSIKKVRSVMKVHRRSVVDPGTTLEDAWMKPLVLPSNEEESDATTPSPTKRPRTTTATKLVFKSKILLAPRRKIPPHLLPALKRKRARLVRPDPHGEGSYVVLNFGENAFTMNIYFVPLVVTLRATNAKKSQSTSRRTNSSTTVSSWTPLHAGLADRELSVWGAKGSYEQLGTVVEERLRDASVHATSVLRKCFASASKATTDQDREILEITALVQFLQLVRTTYMADWQDDDDV